MLEYGKLAQNPYHNNRYISFLGAGSDFQHLDFDLLELDDSDFQYYMGNDPIGINTETGELIYEEPYDGGALNWREDRRPTELAFEGGFWDWPLIGPFSNIIATTAYDMGGVSLKTADAVANTALLPIREFSDPVFEEMGWNPELIQLIYGAGLIKNPAKIRELWKASGGNINRMKQSVNNLKNKVDDAVTTKTSSIDDGVNVAKKTSDEILDVANKKFDINVPTVAPSNVMGANAPFKLNWTNKKLNNNFFNRQWTNPSMEFKSKFPFIQQADNTRRIAPLKPFIRWEIGNLGAEYAVNSWIDDHWRNPLSLTNQYFGVFDEEGGGGGDNKEETEVVTEYGKEFEFENNPSLKFIPTTDRERDSLDLMQQGFTNEAITNKLNNAMDAQRVMEINRGLKNDVDTYLKEQGLR